MPVIPCVEHFLKGGKFMEANLKSVCLGSVFLDNVRAIQDVCKFKILDAREMVLT
jgi:hypothetical protein